MLSGNPDLLFLSPNPLYLRYEHGLSRVYVFGHFPYHYHMEAKSSRRGYMEARKAKPKPTLVPHLLSRGSANYQNQGIVSAVRYSVVYHSHERNVR